MKTLKQLPLVIILALLVQACNIPTGSAPAATATVTPPATLPPATEPPATLPPATPPPAPTNTAAPPPTEPAPPPTDPLPTPGFDQPEAILIQQPGPGSRVTSPVTISGMADPTFEQSLAVTILSADGVELATSFTQIGADVGQRGPFSVDVPFTVSQEQQGFLQVYALSAKDGGVTHLSSVGVTLLPGGAASIQPAPVRPEQIILLQPEMGATISGGVAHVEGFGLGSFEQTLLVEVLDENGAVIASAPVTVSAPDLGQPGPFSVDIPYSISGPASGRIQVRDVSPAHGGNTHLTSVEVRLEPVASIPPTGPLSRVALVEALRGGGYVIYFRHAATIPIPDDQNPVVLDDCTTQRLLSPPGEAQAREVGQAFRRLGIPVGLVLSSPFCRSLDTARLAFERAEIEPLLENLETSADEAERETRVAGLRRLLATPPEAGTNTVLSAHGFNINAAAQVTIPEAGAAIFRPDGAGGFELVATVPAEEWATFSDAINR